MKSKFIKSTIILLIGGMLSKLLGMLIRIVLTRVVSTKGISLYMLVLPTFNLFITLCTFGFPTSISKLISEKKRNNKKIILSLIPISLIYNFLLMLLLILISPFISNNLLNNNELYYPIMAIGLTLPFICLSSILKGYFFGKEKMFPYIFSNIIEQIIRLLLTIYLIPNLLKYSLKIAITGVVLINIISEFSSTIVLLIFLPKNKIKKEDFKFDNLIMKDILSISIPTTSSRLIGSLVYCLEPIILTYTLLKVGYQKEFITLEYGIINGYAYSLLLIPSFFTNAISSALLPVVSNNYVRGNYLYTRNKIKQGILFSLFIGIPITLIFMFIPEVPLKFIYNTNLGINYIKICAPFFLLYYIQTPLTSSMQAMGLAKQAMKGTLYGSIIRILLLFSLSLLKIGLYSLIIATIVNILFITIHHLYFVNKYLKKE